MNLAYQSTSSTSTSAAASGSALAVSSRPSQKRGTPGSVRTSITSPSLVTREEAQRIVDQLSPIKSMSTFVKVERRILTGVSMRTGGADRRRLAVGLKFSSRCEPPSGTVGLPSFVVPVGLPVGPRSSDRTPQPNVVQPTPESAQPPTPPLPDNRAYPLLAPCNPTPPQMVTRNPLDITWEAGAPHLSKFTIKADDQEVKSSTPTLST